MSEPLDGNNLGQTFLAYVEQIIVTLGIDEPIRQQIIDMMTTLDDKSKYKIISDTGLKTNVDQLLEADKTLNDLVRNGVLKTFYEKGGDNKVAWDDAMSQVARLQGLIILRKISQNDCDSLIKTLLGAFNQKLQAVNTVLTSDLNSQAGGADNNYLVKYLKYKNKYLKLLKNNM
tara:strand:- start:424 stop:945 length:522 start_codon:yes stop_codon:yes gene_type:complete